MLRGALRAVLARRGLELKAIGAPIRGYAEFMRQLRGTAFRPRTIIDVGVATGTPWLYGQFPGAKLVLVEPNARYQADLGQIARTHGADVFRHAVGATAGQVTLHEDQQVPSSSGLLPVAEWVQQHRAAEGTVHTFRELTVPMKTLDETIATSYQGPYLLKLDVEGYECQVLQGAAETLRQTDLLIAETSVIPRFRGGYSFAEMIDALDRLRFRLFDILNVVTQGQNGPINYIDAAYVRLGSALDNAPEGG